MNQYQILAHERKWPFLVAIDEAPTEPSPKALPGFLGSLASPLTYPVAIDSTGQVADGYQVKNQPWLALTSTSGKILWSHDGWLPLSKIEATMAKYFPHS